MKKRNLFVYRKQAARALYFLIAFWLVPCFVHAQDKEITLAFPSMEHLDGSAVYIQPLSTKLSVQAMPMTQDGTRFKASVPMSDEGLYSISFVRNNVQSISVVKAEGSQAATLPIEFVGKNFMATDCDDNKALGAFGVIETEELTDLWIGSHENEALRKLVTGFEPKADSITKAYKCSPEIAQYIKMWAYTTAGNACSSLSHILKCKPSEVPFKVQDVLCEPGKVLDSPRARLFPNTPSVISAFVPRDLSLSERLDWLHGHFQCKEIIDMVSNQMVSKFISTFNYNAKYDEGLALMKELTEKYNLDKQYLNKFIANKVTIKGSAFPDGLTFQDKDGKTHTFDEFKGKYVFIDLWASWCVPCCKEVPYLQKLEKEVQNPDVVFLSISIDQKKEPWLKKMQALNMHGNQWHDANSSLANALNVRGIPFFVIYDKEGKLHYYNAPRPSQPFIKEMLEGLK